MRVAQLEFFHGPVGSVHAAHSQTCVAVRQRIGRAAFRGALALSSCRSSMHARKPVMMSDIGRAHGLCNDLICLQRGWIGRPCNQRLTAAVVCRRQAEAVRLSPERMSSLSECIGSIVEDRVSAALSSPPSSGAHMTPGSQLPLPCSGDSSVGSHSTDQGVLAVYCPKASSCLAAVGPKEM